MLTIEHNQIEIESKPAEAPELKRGLKLHFESGLLGFEANKDFELILDDELHPYQWLKGVDADQSFLVIPPAMAVGNYGVEIADDDVVLLDLKDPVQQLKILLLHQI